MPDLNHAALEAAVLVARAAYDPAESYPMRAALLTVTPPLSAAARRKALEEAAALLESGAAVSLPMVRGVLLNSAEAFRIIALGRPA